MDGTADGGRRREYSRAPEVEDLVALCRSLNDAGAAYILIGGFAVILNGYVRATKDIDLLVDSSPSNIRAVKSALASLPDDAARLIEDDDVERYGVVRVADEIVVDLMARAAGLDYAAATAIGVERVEIEGVAIPVASRKLLIRTKQTVRPHDAADVQFLRSLEEEK